jgi:tetrahydromethanopterin S-methyltransferase subunit F
MVPHWRRFGGAGFLAGFVFACMILISLCFAIP